MVNAKENVMTRISILYVVSSMLAALALSANGAIAKGGGNHGGGSDAGKTKVNEISIKKTSDKASPGSFRNNGKHIKNGKLYVR
jgi:type VI protein secretion system component Hcp